MGRFGWVASCRMSIGKFSGQAGCTVPIEHWQASGTRFREDELVTRAVVRCATRQPPKKSLRLRLRVKRGWAIRVGKTLTLTLFQREREWMLDSPKASHSL